MTSDKGDEDDCPIPKYYFGIYKRSGGDKMPVEAGGGRRMTLEVGVFGEGDDNTFVGLDEREGGHFNFSASFLLS